MGNLVVLTFYFFHSFYLFTSLHFTPFFFLTKTITWIQQQTARQTFSAAQPFTNAWIRSLAGQDSTLSQRLEESIALIRLSSAVVTTETTSSWTVSNGSASL